jgi:hypothetical protein
MTLIPDQDMSAPAAGPYVPKSDGRWVLLGAALSLVIAFVHLLAALGIVTLRSGSFLSGALFVLWLGIGLAHLWRWKTQLSPATIARDGVLLPGRFGGPLPWRLVEACERQCKGGELLRHTIDPRAYAVVRRRPWVVGRVRGFDVRLPIMRDREIDEIATFCTDRIAEARRQP